MPESVDTPAPVSTTTRVTPRAHEYVFMVADGRQRPRAGTTAYLRFGFVALPSIHNVSDSSRWEPVVPTCFVPMPVPFLMT